MEITFGALGLVPAERTATIVEASISGNYTTALNLVFIALAAVLVWRFLATGGATMLGRMGGPPRDSALERAGVPSTGQGDP